MRHCVSGKLVATAALVAVAMFILAWAGIQLTRETDRIAAVWLANGAVLAILLRRAQHDWPLLFATAWGANIVANMVSGDAWSFAAVLASANMIEIAIAAHLMARLFGPEDRFDSRAVIKRFLLSALAAPAVSAMVAAAFLMIAVDAPFGRVLVNWYVSDALGLLTIAPLLLAYRREEAAVDWQGRIEPWLIFASAMAIAFYVFGQSREPLLFTIAPVILCAAFRLRLFTAMVIVAAVAVVAAVQTLSGNGIIAATSFNLTERMYVLQLFMAANLFIVLPLRALIGERDRLGAAWAHSERLFRRISEASPAGIIHFDAAARPSYVNARWTELTGQEFDALSGEHWLDAIDPKFRGAARSLWANARATDQPLSAEYPYLREDRPAGWAELNIYPELDGIRLIGFVARLTDVTARRAAEIALAQSEASHRLLADNSNDIIIRIDADGTLRSVSQASLRVLGYTPDEVLGRTANFDIHPNDALAVRAAFRQALGASDPATAIYRQRNSRGRYLWLEASYRRVIDPVTGECEVIASIRDVDRRRQAEMLGMKRAAQLRESHRLLTMAEELAQVGHWRFDFGTGLLECSRQAGLASDIDGATQIAPGDIFARVHPEDRVRALRLVAGARRSRSPVEDSVRLRLADGRDRYLRAGAQADFDVGGNVTGLFGVIRDTTGYVVVQQQLIAARDDARTAAVAKSHFLATMSHEIRTPMTGVLGMIDLLQNEPAPAKRDRYFETLRQCADLLMAVLDDVLDFSKIDSNAVKFDLVDFDLKALTASTLDLFGNAASRKGLLLSLDARIEQGAMVRGDPVRIQQVINNLISNAIKFTARGRVMVKLSDHPPMDGKRRWEIEVRDTGVGIDPTDMGRLFEPFVQADTTLAHQLGGTGLGLAISRKLVEAMGGQVGVTSRLGRGSTFRLELPLEDSAGQEAAAPASAPRVLSVPGGPLDLMVAEDNPVNQMLIGAILRRLGHKVTCVDNGRLAVEAARLRAYDCILMDMQMPDMDGLAATRAIRASGGPCADIAIIALTADASPERRRFYDGAGLTAFLTKPIDRAQLCEQLAAVAQDKAQSATPPIKDTTAVTRSADGSPFDDVYVCELRAAIGSDRVDQLLELMDRECVDRPVVIRELVRAGAIDQVRREAHGLKGAASGLGAVALARVAQRLELAPGKAAAGRLLGPLDREALRTRGAIALAIGPDRQRAG